MPFSSATTWRMFYEFSFATTISLPYCLSLLASIGFVMTNPLARLSVSLGKHCLLVPKRYFKGRTPNTLKPKIYERKEKLLKKQNEKSNRTHLVKAYLNDSEYEKVCRMVEGTKTTNSNLIRKLLNESVFVEFPPAEFDSIRTELRHIGINLNQLATTAYKLGFVDERAYYDNTRRLWDTVAELSGMYGKCIEQIRDDVAKERSKKNVKKQ